MKRRELKDMLRKDIRSIAPSKAPNPDFSLLPDPIDSQRRLISARRFIVAALALLVVAVTTALPYLFGGETPSTTTTPITTSSSQSDGTLTDTTTADQVVDLDATPYVDPIVTVALLSDRVFSSGAVSLSRRLADPILLLDDQIALMNAYVAALESTLSGDGGLSAEILTSDREGFQSLLLATGLDLTGAATETLLYYNAYGTDGEFATIEGIVVQDGNETPFSGVVEDDQGETKIRFTAVDPDQPADYVVTTVKIEDDERKFEASIYVDDELAASSLVRFEVEAEEAKVSVEIDRGSAGTIAFDVKREWDEGAWQIRIEYGIVTTSGSESGTIHCELVEADGILWYHYDALVGSETKTYVLQREPNPADDIQRNPGSTAASVI